MDATRRQRRRAGGHARAGTVKRPRLPSRAAAVLRVALPAALLAALLAVGHWRVGIVPALGPLLDPVHGVWAVATQPDHPSGTLGLAGAEDSIEVVFDDRGVPHIFARSVEDVARALGYVHAYHRLFQMELQTRATAGRLTEWFGPRALDVDREQRRLGLAWAAERERAALDTAGETGRVLLAYAEGVNARIAQLSARDLPFEYRLLGAAPESWDVLNTFLFMQRMGYTLAYLTPEFDFARVADALGPEVADALVSPNSPIQEPIVPSRRRMPVVEAVELPGAVRAGGAVGAEGPPARPPAGPPSREASNNWVVAGSRTAAGFPLLAGDPHLELTLPSVWYEAHLVVPGRLDVYGVTFPGTPVVAIGFNRDVAWSFTNTGADALDFYAEVLDDSVRPMQYRLDGTWRPLERRIEVYRTRSGRVVGTDTVYFTHRGPVRWSDRGPLSMRWTMLEGSNPVAPLWDIAAARSVDEWLEAMRAYRAPIQNGVVADRAGSIAVLSAGEYPVRPAGGDGRTLWDGTTSTSDWLGFLPAERQPHARDPAQGYLASANQQPMDPRESADYLGADWPPPWRAMRINQLLRADSAVTPDAMRRHQTDPGSTRADWFVPAFLDAVIAERRAGRASADAVRAAELLAEWDRRYTRENERAVLFEEAMRALRAALWDELERPGGGFLLAPSEAVTASLLAAPQHPWWDDARTADEVETRDALLVAALVRGYGAARDRYGEPTAGGWRWDRIRAANIWHPLRVERLSALGIAVPGGPGTLSPLSGMGTHGASWRMVVELGPEVRAWGVYPGGQSGNPLSAWYRDRIPTWAAGALDSLPFPRAADELPDPTVRGRLILTGGRR
jgi:penicillin G amidase